MWKYPKNIEPNNVQVGEFKGLSRLPIINQGELQVSKNLVFDFYPVMSVRRGRTLVNQVEGKPQSFIAVNGKFAVVAGNKLFYDGGAVPDRRQKIPGGVLGQDFYFPGREILRHCHRDLGQYRHRGISR